VQKLLFVTIKYQHWLAVLFRAWLTECTQALVHAEAEATVMHFSNMIWNKQGKGILNMLFSGNRRKLQPQTSNSVCMHWICLWVERLIKCIMVSYAEYHSLDTYRMMNYKLE